MAAPARFTFGSDVRGFRTGRTIPTRGTSVTIQPNIRVFLSVAEIGGTACELGNPFTACRIRNMQTAQFEIQRE